MTEDELEGIWAVDPVRGSRLVLLQYHFEEHGAEVGAEDIDQYVRKAIAFAREKKGRGRDVIGTTEGVRRGRKEHPPWYVDITPNGEIVSFGSIGEFNS